MHDMVFKEDSICDKAKFDTTSVQYKTGYRIAIVDEQWKKE